MQNTKTRSIDLNCDMGELHPITGLNHDAEIMPFISSCNVCCVAHSGSILLSEQTVKLAYTHKIAVGAHPSYNDKENFGRITPNIDLEKLKTELIQQISIINQMVDYIGIPLNHIKPHGALYNDLARDEKLSTLFINVVKEIDPQLKIYGLANSTFEKTCLSNNMNFVSEVFADRNYESGNQLRSRKQENAVIHSKNKITKHLDKLLEGIIIDSYGESHKVTSDSICLHSDTKGAVDLAKLIHKYIKSKDIAILPVGKS